MMLMLYNDCLFCLQLRRAVWNRAPWWNIHHPAERLGEPFLLAHVYRTKVIDLKVVLLPSQSCRLALYNAPD